MTASRSRDFGKTCRLAGAACIGLFAFFSIPAASQSAQESPAEVPAEVFVEKVDVNVVNVDVYVTDKDGNPVRGLQREQFEVLEDGKPVEISNFYAVEAGQAVTYVPAQVGADGEVAPPPEPPALPEGGSLTEDQRLHLVVYIDNLNIEARHRNKLFKELVPFLRQRLSAGDRVMVAAFDRTVEVLTPWTRDPVQVEKALASQRKVGGGAGLVEANQRILVDELQNPSDFDDLSSTIDSVRAFAQELYDLNRISIGGLQGFVNSLAGMPGRKAVLYVSSGLRQRPGEELLYAAQNATNNTGPGPDGSGGRIPEVNPVAEGQSLDMTRFFAELGEQANANRVSFYSLSAGGYDRLGGIDAGFGGNGFNTTPVWTSFEEQVRRDNLSAPLRQIAAETGGSSILNAGNMEKALSRLSADFDNFYSLGYRTSVTGKSEYRNIDVRVKVPGLEVRHRKGFREKSTDERTADRTMTALLFGQQDNPLGVDVEIGRIERSGDRFEVPVLVKVPLGQVALLPVAKTREGRLKLFLILRDEKGRMSQMKDFDVPLSIPEDKIEEALGKHYAFETKLVVRRGEQRLAVGVRDDFATTASFVSRDITPGRAQAQPRGRG